jgi:lipid-A-disaccharide synthase
VPELIQQQFTAAGVANALRPLLADTPERDRMIADLAEVRRMLLPPESSGSIRRVCDAVEALMEEEIPRSGRISTASV